MAWSVASHPPSKRAAGEVMSGQEAISKRLAVNPAAVAFGCTWPKKASGKGGLARLKDRARELIEPKIVLHGGSTGKTTADGLFAKFAKGIAAAVISGG